MQIGIYLACSWFPLFSSLRHLVSGLRNALAQAYDNYSAALRVTGGQIPSKNAERVGGRKRGPKDFVGI